MEGWKRNLGVLLLPGIGLKRWLALAGAGVLLLVLGATLAAIELTALSLEAADRLIGVGRALTLASVLPVLWRGVLFGALGLAVFGVGAFQAYRTLLSAATYRRAGGSVVENLSVRRSRRGGPAIAAIGGGTGMASLLRGLKLHTEDITAIVTAADDGGSSGRLRSDFGVSPPGDARQCLIALSDSEPLMDEVLSYRFETGAGLEGHSMGNLLLTALAQNHGDLHDALQAAARLLNVKGQVVPSTREPDLTLFAETEDAVFLRGESAVGTANKPISHLWVEPRGAPANPAALEAIARAEIIVIGPGSLYTSILPNFLIRGVSKAVEDSKAPKVFVCNVATQYGETDNFDAESHLRVFEEQAGVGMSHFLVNARPIAVEPEFRQDPIQPERPHWFDGAFISADLVDERLPTRHDPHKLAAQVLRILREG